jgi:hypothetical protein
MDLPHDIGVGVVPQLGARPVEEPSREELRPVAAVEHEDLSGPDALEDLPAAPRHRAPATTPSKALALTTASVESVA